MCNMMSSQSLANSFIVGVLVAFGVGGVVEFVSFLTKVDETAEVVVNDAVVFVVVTIRALFVVLFK